jgi:hypothetical protein
MDAGLGPECASERLGSVLGVPASMGSTERRFLWTAPRDGVYTVDTVGSTFDTVLYALESCTGPEITCADGNGDDTSITLDLQAGEQVVLVVDGDSGSQSGTAEVSVFE